MSLQDARDFVQKAKNSPEIQKQAHERKHDIPGVGREHGHEFTKEELRQAMNEDAIESPGDDPDTCICA